MNWNQLISAKRFGMEEFHEERQENRSEFQRDYDRLIFSAPFRRLQNKTQVFFPTGNRFYRFRRLPGARLGQPAFRTFRRTGHIYFFF